MAYTFSIPFYAFRLHLKPGVSLLAPLADQSVLRLQQPLPILAGQYAEALQQKVLDKGQIGEILNHFQQGDFHPGTVKVPFRAAKDGLAYPAFELEFFYYFNTSRQGIWGIVPTLGIEVFAKTEEALQPQLRDAIRLEFTRKRRLQAVQGIVSAIWYDAVELQQHPVELRAPSPKELEEKVQNKQDRLLPKAAEKLQKIKAACYGRPKELHRLAQILNGSFQRSVLLVGPSGVGKTALVRELHRQRQHLKLKGIIWETTASTLIKELMKETGWQENLTQLCQELSSTRDILFLRNLMDLFEVGKSEGNSVSMADYLRPFLAQGSITILTECTEEELANIELKSPNFLSFFQRIPLQEPPPVEAEAIILKKAKDIARQQKLEMDKSAVREAIRLSRRFTPYNGMPGRPIRFLESILLQRPAAARLTKGGQRVERAEVISQFCQETGMPAFMVDPDVPMDPEKVMADFNASVFGQEEAVERVAGVLSTVKTALARSGKPIASLLFVGPTGVGKTELAKVIARFMFGSSDQLTRFDMSEFSTPYEVQRLTGTGSFSEGLLTSAVRKAPFGLILFDEIEKAHGSFYDLLLQILGEGRLTDSQGKLVNFCSNIIVMTSNVGAESLSAQPIGWKSGWTAEGVKQHFTVAVQKYFRPELFNRIDQMVPFAPLDQLTIRYVVEREIELLRKREGIGYRRLHLSLSEEVYDYLAEQGYSQKYGARQLQRTIREKLIIPLAKTLNTHDPDDQLEVRVRLTAGRLAIHAEADPLGLDLLLEEYTKISYTDYASQLRRSMTRLREGHYYIKLLSELDLLRQRKKKKGNAFWKDRQAAEQLGYYMDTQSKSDALYEEIQLLEAALSQSCLGTVPYETDWAGQLEDWEKKLFLLKLELYARLVPSDNYCYLSLYGEQAAALLRFYLQLLKNKGYEYEAQTIWRSGAVEEPGPKGSEPEVPYITRTLPPNEVPQADSEAEVLLGANFKIQGAAAYLYFKSESGAQEWHLPPDEPARHLVLVSNQPIDPPNNIHRWEAYINRAVRRVIKPDNIKDNYFKLNREYNKGQLPELLQEQLDQHFKIKLDRAVL